MGYTGFLPSDCQSGVKGALAGELDTSLLQEPFRAHVPVEETANSKQCGNGLRLDDGAVGAEKADQVPLGPGQGGAGLN